MRLEQLNVLNHENLCGWNSYYTTRTCTVGTTIIPREAGIWMIGAIRQTYPDRGPRAVYFFFLLAYVFFIDGINSFSIIIVYKKRYDT